MLPIPTGSGNGPAVKAVCCNASNFGGTDPLSQAAALLNGYTALQVPAAPPTAFNVGSWTLGTALDFSSGSATANGLFSQNSDPSKIFGTDKNNWAGLFAGYIRIDPSSDGSAVEMTFVLASDDGFKLAISDGTTVHTTTCDAGRAMTTNFLNTNYYAGCQKTFTPTTDVTVSFPGTGGLFPFDLIYYNATGDQGLELSWASGAPTAPEAGALDGYVLVPADHIYAPAIAATMTVSDPNSTVQPGDTLTYAVQITNTGNAPISSYTFAVHVDTTKLTGLAGGMGGSCSNSNGLLVCPLSTVLNPGDSTSGTFTAVVHAGLSAATVIDVQGVVTGLATTSDVATAVGGAAEVTAGEIYALTDDPNVVAGSNFENIDTGNTPAALASSLAVGLADDDATRVVVGSPPEAPPVITGPSTPGISDAQHALSGTSNAPIGVAVDVQVTNASTSATSQSCTATTGATGAWSCANASFTDGSYTARARLVDAGGNAGPWSATYSFVIQSPPAPTITAPTAAQAIHNSSVSISGTSSEANGQIVTATVGLANGTGASTACDATVASGEWTCNVSLADGSYLVTASVVEVTGALGTASGAVAFTVSTGGACGSTIAQTTSPTNVKRPTFSGTAMSGLSLQVCAGGTSACGSGSTVLCSAGTVGNAGTWQCTAGADLADGVHTVVAVAGSGNSLCASNDDVFTVDTTPPAPPGFNAPSSPTSQSKPVFTGTGIPGDTIEVGNGVGTGIGEILCSAVVAQDGTWSCTSSTLTDGSYTLEAIQIDLATNESTPTSRSLVVNTQKPDAPTLRGPASPTNNPQLAFTGTSDANTTVTVRDANANVICTSSGITVSGNATVGAWSCSSATLPDGSYTFTAVATSATNVASDPSASLTIVVDTTPPAAPVLDAVPSPTAQHFPLFEGTAEAGAQVVVFEGTTQLCSGPSAGTFSCVSTVSLANGMHTVTANATDAAGNVSPMSAAVTFTVDDTSAPAPTLDPLAAAPGGQPGFTAQTNPTFTGTGVPGDLVTARVVAGQTLCTATVAGDGSWSCASTIALTAIPATMYSVEAVQQAPAGTHAVSPPSPAINFIVDGHVPQTPELDPPATPSQNHAPTFTGSAEASDAVEVDDATLGQLCSTSADAQGNFSCAPPMPLNDGTYALTARSYSRAGVPSLSSTPARPLTLFTPSGLAAPTLDQPTSPTNDARPTFTGTASAGSNVSVRSDGAVLCSGPVATGRWSCQPATALTDGTYLLTARAADTSGDVSPDSNSVVLVVDTTAPAPPLILVPASGAELENPAVVASGTAQVGSVVSLLLDGAAAGAPINTARDGSWSQSLGTLSGGTHTLSATAADIAGNVSAPASVTFDIVVGGTVRGGCASGGVPMPLLALLTLLFFWPRRSGSLAQRLLHASRPRWARSISFLTVFVTMFIFATAARAQVDLGRLQPASGGDGLLGVEGARPPVDADARPSVNLWLDNAYQPLVFDPSTGGREVLISNRVESFLAAQFHIWRPFSLAAQVPFLLAETGDLSALPPSSRPSSNLGGALGDIRITPRLALMRQENSPLDLSAEASLTLPTSTGGAYAGDSRVQFEALASAGRHLVLADLDFELLGNLLVRFRAPEQILDVKTGDELGLRAGVAWLPERTSAAIPRRVFLEAEAESELRGAFAAGTVPAEWRAGASFCAVQSVSFDVGAGTALGDGIGTPRARIIFGFGYAPDICGAASDHLAARTPVSSAPPSATAPDTGSPDVRPAIVTHVAAKPSASTSAAASASAPAPAPGSQVASISPAPASGKQADTQTIGTPTIGTPTIGAQTSSVGGSPPSSGGAPFIAAPPPPPEAADALALPDADALPPPPMPVAAPPTQAAVPAPAHSSGKLGGNDDDSLPLAPLVALNDVHPAVVAPVAPGPAPTADDRDGDGVADREDSCPDQRGPAKNHGCPEDTEMHVFLDGDHVAIDSRVEFRSGSSALERRSLPLLQQLALVLQNHPELTHLEVRAHTDSSLPDDQAKALSQERAETVVKFLGGQGIPAERLSAEGMGSSSPIAPNVTAKGRKKNERIEIVIAK